MEGSGIVADNAVEGNKISELKYFSILTEDINAMFFLILIS